MATYFYYFDSYTPTATGLSGVIESYSSMGAGYASVDTDLSFSPASSIDLGDVVMLYSSTDNTKFIYGVLNGISQVSTPEGEIIGWGISISYDYRIYTDLLGNMNRFLIYAKDEGSYISVKENAVDSYKINANIETAAYSEQYIRYKVTTKYDLVIDPKRRNLLGDFFDVVKAKNIFIINDCENPNGVAYKLFMENDSFESFNNKFRKDVKFRIVA